MYARVRQYSHLSPPLRHTTFQERLGGGNTPITISRNSNKPVNLRTTNNAIVLENLPSNAKVEVYSLQGKLIYKSSKSLNQANQGSDKIPIKIKGVYIIKAGTQSFRVAVR